MSKKFDSQGREVIQMDATAGVMSSPWTRGATFTGGTTEILVPTNDVPIYIQEDCTLVGVVILTRGGPGDCELDIWKSAFGAYPPTVLDSIVGSTVPEITGGETYEDFLLTGWDVNFSEGDTLMINLVSSSTFTAVSIYLLMMPLGSTALDGYTDERARDTVAAMIQNTPTVQWTYDDLLETLEAAVPEFDSADAGVVPGSGGGTSNFLRADGTWAAPPGSTAQSFSTFSGTITTYNGATPVDTDTQTYRYTLTGRVVNLFIPNSVAATHATNAGIVALSGIPSAIRPDRDVAVPCLINPGGGAVSVPGMLFIVNSGAINAGTAFLYFYDHTYSVYGNMNGAFIAGGIDVGFGNVAGTGGQYITYSLD